MEAWIPLIAGIVLAAFAGLLGYVLGNKSTTDLRLDIAGMTPLLANVEDALKEVKVAMESNAKAFQAHTELPGHPVALERIEDVRRDINSLGGKIARTLEKGSPHGI